MKNKANCKVRESTTSYEVIAIAAIGSKSRALGKNNDLLWRIPADLKHFKTATKGHPVIMGYKTYESLPAGVLPNRTNIIMTLGDEVVEGATMAHSPEEALEIAKKAPGAEKIYIIGGGQIYKLMLPYTDTLDLTIIEECPNNISLHADTFFPEYEKEFTQVVSEEQCKYGELKYSFITLTR